MSTLVGFMGGVRVVFGVAVSPVFRASIPVMTKLALGSAAMLNLRNIFVVDVKVIYHL
jgi:hypothetical protein